MGENFFGTKEAVKFFKVKLKAEESAKWENVPFGEDALRGRRETHVLVLYFPLSISQIRDRAGNLFAKQNPGVSENFMKKSEGIEPGWKLVRKVPASTTIATNSYLSEKYLSWGEKIPEVRIMVYTIVGHALARGKRLLPFAYARCREEKIYEGRSFHIALGMFSENGPGLSMVAIPDNQKSPHLYVASVFEPSE